jgi:ADP-ribose pyrophosphatase YjhB (NUDIX family)
MRTGEVDGIDYHFVSDERFEEMIKRLNIRVYGLLINHQNEILLVDEQIDDFKFTKFPGGGLELGEGTTDCLKT